MRERTWPSHARHPPRQDLAWAISEGLCEPGLPALAACKALGIVLQAAVQASVCELADLELRLRDRRLARHAQDSLLQSCSCGEPGVAI